MPESELLQKSEEELKLLKHRFVLQGEKIWETDKPQALAYITGEEVNAKK